MQVEALAVKLTQKEGELIQEKFEVKKLVHRIRKEKESFGENYVKKIQMEGALSTIFRFIEKYGNLVINNDIDLYSCTSWCKSKLYDANFRW